MKTGFWEWRDVVAVFALRLLLVLLFGRLILPLLGITDYLSLQVVDSSIFILLVLIFLRIKGISPARFFPDSVNEVITQLTWGAVVGFAVFFLGNYGEKLALKYLLVDVGPHPLINLTANARTSGQFLFPFLVGGFLVPVAEEFFYRGFLYPVLRRHLGVLLGIIASGLLFTLAHFNQIWFVEIFLVGVILTWLYQRFDSLFPGIIAHIILNGSRLLSIYLSL
ncbi:CPBP family intramembrane metalloprotease [Thermanaerosceptrum fracticalcis]|jgi:hypothetical protein|uniref:CPBP family intramembrane metalloprotease n=1 Tax=Thermanaerosceptrum fracticalcis TaxID=1712410 RepID=A0A7G6E6J7_THEFR|nr:type II CAAX endopeptidase family protein [Thermanaerosceptrum fracticalcis]QNB47701.1 CPBP family intramembrane metalloprotease [Thermanaerosceptrum fracticalcis]